MTTIAWDGKTLAADRQTSEAGAVYRIASKIEPIPGGHMACCGTTTQIFKFKQWARKGMRGKPPTADDMGAIVAKRGRVYWVEDDAVIEIPPGERIATGSGWKWAAAAMDFGMDAVAAVAYASTRDNCTGGGVDSVTP